jgi:hypothetical protein
VFWTLWGKSLETQLAKMKAVAVVLAIAAVYMGAAEAASLQECKDRASKIWSSYTDARCKSITYKSISATTPSQCPNELAAQNCFQVRRLNSLFRGTFERKMQA